MRSARCASAGASLQPSMAAPEAWHRSGTLARAGTTRWRTREEKRPHRLTMPRDTMPACFSSCRLLALASPHWMLVGSHGYDSTVDTHGLTPVALAKEDCIYLE